jgi:hypothetical protein
VRSQVLWMVLRCSFHLAAVGLVLGLPFARFASKLTFSILYQFSARSPQATRPGIRFSVVDFRPTRSSRRVEGQIAGSGRIVGDSSIIGL